MKKRVLIPDDRPVPPGIFPDFLLKRKRRAGLDENYSEPKGPKIQH